MAIRTRLTDLLEIEHPVVLGGMGSGTSPELVAAVSEAGGLGVQGGAGRPPEVLGSLAAEIRSRTRRPFGVNLLLFMASPEQREALLQVAPPVFSTSWPMPEDDLRPLFERAHSAGSRVMHMVNGVPEAERAAEAGADVIVAQGTEGGGHVALISTLVLTPMVVRAVAPVPVLAAGGIADGSGLAAALMLGAEGVLMGTRFLATPESPWPASFKQAIVASDGHDTLLSDILDIAKGNLWPGAFDRVRRNRLLEDWLGREGEVRRHRNAIAARMRQAVAEDDAENGELNFGQVAGLIDAIEPAAEIVRRVAAEAEQLLTTRSGLVTDKSPA
ncbi:MAG: nitronate monooxygenase [Chloroflexi bacterium]|nr:MAG: nitronate monooxygenase [Chloroflexota bacterium]